MMSGCSGMAAIAILALAASTSAVDFGFRLGTRPSDLWPAITGFEGVRSCELDLMAEMPLPGAFRAGVRAGVFGSASRGKDGWHSKPLEDVLGIDARAVFVATAPLASDVLSARAGLGIGYTRLNYWNSYSTYSTYKLTENKLAATVLLGPRMRLSRRVWVGAEVETPVVGWFRGAEDEGYSYVYHYSGWRFASYAPNLSVALMLTP